MLTVRVPVNLLPSVPFITYVGGRKPEWTHRLASWAMLPRRHQKNGDGSTKMRRGRFVVKVVLVISCDTFATTRTPLALIRKSHWAKETDTVVLPFRDWACVIVRSV